MKSASRRNEGAIYVSTGHRLNLSQRVVQILKRYILIELLEPGDRLPPERWLAESLNVSRTVLREALSQLVGEGLLRRVSPRILCVAEFDRSQLAAEIAPIDAEEAELQSLIELRVIIEIGAIEAIVQRATDEDLRKIEHWVVEGERRVAAGESLNPVDAGFHTALLKTLGNPAINSLLPLIEENMRQSLAVHPQGLMVIGTPDDFRVVTEHRRIFEAVKRRDVSTTRIVMLAHLSGYLNPEWSDALVERKKGIGQMVAENANERSRA